MKQNVRHCGRLNSGCTAEVQSTPNRLLRCPGFLRLPAEIPTAATSSPRFIRHRRRFGSSPTDFARSVGEHMEIIRQHRLEINKSQKENTIHSDGVSFWLPLLGSNQRHCG